MLNLIKKKRVTVYAMLQTIYNNYVQPIIHKYSELLTVNGALL